MSIKSDVYKTLCELHEAGKPPHREVILTEMQAQNPRMTQDMVDAALKDLRSYDHLIDRTGVGTYTPKQAKSPDRAISVTVIPDGLVKCEIGDLVIDLSRTETRLLGYLLAGFGFGFGR